MKNIVVSILVIVISCFLTYRWTVSRCYKRFTYTAAVPQFDEHQEKLISQLMPTIAEELPSLHKYYVAGLSREHERIIVTLLPLPALQAGKLQGQGLVGIIGQEIRMVFDKELEFLERIET